MRFIPYPLLIVALLIPYQRAAGQADSSERTTQAFVEVGALGKSGRGVPFWQRANQYGVVPLANSFATVRAGVSSDYRPEQNRRVDWGYGVEVVGNVGPIPANQQVYVPEAYIKARWRQLEVYAGRRKTIVGLVDTLLTSGAYAMSGNALPLPTIQLGTRGYVPLPFTNGAISINATFANAWFENVNRKVSNALMQQSTLYIRIGRPSGPIRVYGGINHQVTWNGYSPFIAPGVSNDGQLPSSFKAYLYAITALPYPNAAVDGNVTSFDETNRIGNHLGSLDLGAELDVGDYTIFVYRQNPFDTGAIWYLTTIADGLNGLSIRRKSRGDSYISVDRALVEFLYTVDQGGNEFVIEDPQRRGKVDYFNNAQYIDSWTTRAHTIGTPFLTPEGDITPAIPYGPIINNRVSMVHAGLNGRVGEKVMWLLKLSYSQNLGTYNAPLPGFPQQFSGLFKVAAPLTLPLLGTMHLTATVATDQGAFLPNSTGGYIGLRKNWSSKTQKAPVKQNQRSSVRYF
ncbi:capsule assembly Wzi family protein [Spirosoma luteum]|uniref:capsule assembly Wzi family protein n=1 Tax=Spirosoma luteum TaxID=431553 RepID=UPI0012F8F824|nr:capsule assembly Wzi family protein [Spirosoma luteum]